MAKEMIIKAISEGVVEYDLTYVDDGEGKCHLVFSDETKEKHKSIMVTQLLEIFGEILDETTGGMEPRTRLQEDGIVAARMRKCDHSGRSAVEVLRDLGGGKYQQLIPDVDLLVYVDEIQCSYLEKRFHFDTILAIGMALHKKYMGREAECMVRQEEIFKSLMTNGVPGVFDEIQIEAIVTVTDIASDFGVLSDF